MARTSQSNGIVTPEAVALGFDDAAAGSRGVAAMLDFLLIAVVLLLLQLGAFAIGDGLGALPDWVGVTVALVLAFVALFGYPVGFETLMRGRTPGKAALGLRVLTVEGAPIGFRHAAIRAAIGLIELRATFGFVALVASVLSSRGQRLGDHVAGTVVVHEGYRRDRPAAMPVSVPQGYEAYAATIDATGASAEDYAAARRFLLRAEQLTPEARERVATGLASGIASRISHRPPPGVSPRAFLQCFAARYQERDARQHESRPA